jgi:hypothetical protein
VPQVPGQIRLTQKISFVAGRRALDWLSTSTKEERDVLTAFMSIQPYLGFLEIESEVIHRHIPESPFWTEGMRKEIDNEVLGCLARMLTVGFQAGWYAAKLSERGAPPIEDNGDDEHLKDMTPTNERKM